MLVLKMPFYGWGIGVLLWIIGFCVSWIIGHYVCNYIVDEKLWPTFIRDYPDEKVNYPKGREIVRCLGRCELLMFTIAFIMNWPQWIAVWLGVKTSVHWYGWKKDKCRAFNIFLIGNAIIIIISFLGATIIKAGTPFVLNK
ncbi:MAG: hypothetical protein WBE75_05625 [Candidatus Omnitrophota bacterium]